MALRTRNLDLDLNAMDLDLDSDRFCQQAATDLPTTNTLLVIVTYYMWSSCTRTEKIQEYMYLN